MVTVINALKRTSAKGDFMVLELMGGIEMVQSQTTGKFYATARKCTVPSSFTEPVAMAMIGSQMPGMVERVKSEPYDYTVKETGEVIKLAHTYEYRPEKANEIPTALQTVPQLIRGMALAN